MNFMDKKWLIIGGGLFVVFIVGMVWLSGVEQTGPKSNEEKFVSYAAELGLNTDQFLVDLRSDDAKQAVTEGRAAGNAANVDSTPTVIVNGETMRPSTVAEFQKVIEDLVAQGNVQERPDGYNVKGAAQPLVLIEEYSDFQCPACGSMYPLLKENVEANIDTTALVYKHFPLTQIHPFADIAARAAEAAGKQGKFWEMHDLLFERQGDWS